MFSGKTLAPDLHLIQVYFDDYTKNFDKIERSQKATVTVIISTIGGTMGLLTGFSLLSGVEIIYYATKIFLAKIKEKVNPSPNFFDLKY